MSKKVSVKMTSSLIESIVTTDCVYVNEAFISQETQTYTPKEFLALFLSPRKENGII